MKNMRFEINQLYLSGELNTIFLSSKFILSILETAETMPYARKALRSVAQSLFEQAADVYGRILRDYDDTLPYCQHEQILLQQESGGASENIVQQGADQ